MVVDGNKPVCLTGAMRTADEPGADGSYNLLCAIRVAASEQARGMGALVVMNAAIHAARDVMKTHTANVAAFQSPEWGPIGYVDEDCIVFSRLPQGRQHIAPPRLGGEVDLIKAVTGSDAAYLDFAISRGISGIIIESLGCGNIPPGMVPGIERALEKGLPVILAARPLAGRILGVYGYPGGAKPLLDSGVISAGALTAAKARLKLRLLLGLYADGAPSLKQIKTWFVETY
ncbi:MAG: asparaginase domain-containing protein [Desulfovibrionaceae bacterium]|nr:asparaginase domain-containing protein [Desulfovibrionaceae bacterium]